MKRLANISFVSFAAAMALTVPQALAGPPEVMRSPAGVRYAEQRLEGQSVLPNGRLITPLGKQYRIHPHPYGLAVSPDGNWVVTVNSGRPLTLSILDLRNPNAPALSQIPENPEGEGDVLASAFMGVAIDATSRVVYVAGGPDYSVLAFDLETRERLFRLGCEHESADGVYTFGFIGDMRLTPDGKTLFAVDIAHFRMLVVNLEARKVVASIGVGRYPFGAALSPDGQRAYVANVGMYHYEYYRDADGNPAMAPFPAYGVPSKEAAEGVTVGAITAPGLGDPNDLRAMSVWTLDVSTPRAPKVTGKSKTGHLVGEQLEDFPAVGGSSPNSMVATDSVVYVSNGSNDSISVIDARTGQHVREIDLFLDERSINLRGLIPFGLALSPDGQYLFVAEAGVNAVGVVRVADERVLGHIPVGWFPSKLAVSPDGQRLFVANAKGVGSGPNDGPNHTPGDPTHVGDLMRGTISVIELPDALGRLEALSEQVVRQTVQYVTLEVDARPKGHPVPPYPGTWKSPIKHVVYVTKENRTYDEVFGVLPNGRGDAELCRLGRPITVESEDGSSRVENVLLMPNHIALARRFAVSDNFYCDSDHSADGHRWLVGTYPNEFFEARHGMGPKGEAPGNFIFTGASGAIYPEDYNEAGSIWEHFERNRIRFRNFGLGFEFAYEEERQEDYPTGIALRVNYPMPQALFENTSRLYATYNTNIPDQFRMDMFEKEFKTRWLSKREPFPQVITIMLPNDHGAKPRPADGYPYWGSYMSDNDLALGRLVELITHSPFWKHTAILVTEDDAQGYRDTVDAHRSVCMVISPYAKRDYVSHTHTSFGSILKTIFLIHGMPPLNQYDAFASDLHDMFTVKPENKAPYKALPVDARVFDPEQALDPFDPGFNWDKVRDFVPLDDQKYLDTDVYGQTGPAGHNARQTEQ